MSRFSTEALEKVKGTVAEVEARTSGEIVPVILPASDDYTWVRYVLFVKGALLGFLVIEAISLFSPWPLAWDVTFALTGLVGAVSAVLGFVPPVIRWVVGVKRLTEAAESRARTLFIDHGVTETRDRTGILILISRLEHEIVVLADRGINDKVEKGYWNALCDEFVHEVRAGREVEGLLSIIRKAGDELAKHFPRRADDTNELSNELRGPHGKGEPR